MLPLGAERSCVILWLSAVAPIHNVGGWSLNPEILQVVFHLMQIHRILRLRELIVLEHLADCYQLVWSEISGHNFWELVGAFHMCPYWAFRTYIILYENLLVFLLFLTGNCFICLEFHDLKGFKSSFRRILFEIWFLVNFGHNLFRTRGFVFIFLKNNWFLGGG